MDNKGKLFPASYGCAIMAFFMLTIESLGQDESWKYFG